MELGLDRASKYLHELDLLFPKERADPQFYSTETSTMFFLTAHLKGYRREDIRIQINEDGSRIIVEGKKRVHDMVMVEWKVLKNEMEIREFRKAFIIPDGVVLDKMKAKFSRDESKLTVTMPKLIKGVRGVEIEQVDEEEISRGNSESLRVYAEEEEEELDKVTSKSQQELNGFEKLPPSADSVTKAADHVPEKVIPMRKEIQGEEVYYNSQDENIGSLGKGVKQRTTITQTSAEKPLVEEYKSPDAESKKMAKGLKETSHEHASEEHGASNSNCDRNEKEQQVDGTDKSDHETFLVTQKKFSDQSTQTDAPGKPKKCCIPIIAGSALLLSLMVFAVHMVRAKDKPPSKKK